MDHCMIDLETFGVNSRAAIVSIGAVAFDVNGTYDKKPFHRYLDVDAQLKKGATVTEGTIKWWMGQGQDAREKITTATTVSPERALLDLKKYLESRGCHYLWGNSARFDLGLLSDMCEAFDVEVFWKFRNEMCYRTVKGLFPELAKIPFQGVRHDAVADCVNQIQNLTNILKEVRL